MTGGLTDVPGLLVGHAQNDVALTGCTVVLAPAGAVGSVDVRGGAPGTIETDLLRSEALVERVHGILLAGGSAFGLAAAAGVVRFLEEQGIGYEVGAWRVPIVPGAILFDLAVGDGAVRPDFAMGYAAAQAARSGLVREGNVGAGTGATVGKLAGIERAMKGGLGTASLRGPGGLIVAALVAVNALGEVRDLDGTTLAGMRADGGGFLDPLEAFGAAPAGGLDATTIGVVATNAQLSKAQAHGVAVAAHDGLARVVVPAHTRRDGDALFVLATGEVIAPEDLVGALAATAVSRAIVRGIRAAVGVAGYPAAGDLRS